MSRDRSLNLNFMLDSFDSVVHLMKLKNVKSSCYKRFKNSGNHDLCRYAVARSIFFSKISYAIRSTFVFVASSVHRALSNFFTLTLNVRHLICHLQLSLQMKAKILGIADLLAKFF